MFSSSLSCTTINPSNAEATFFQSARTQRFLKTIRTLSCWYSLESSLLVLSDEYPFARVSVIFQLFPHQFVFTKFATSSTRVKAIGHHSVPSFLFHSTGVGYSANIGCLHIYRVIAISCTYVRSGPAPKAEWSKTLPLIACSMAELWQLMRFCYPNDVIIKT